LLIAATLKQLVQDDRGQDLVEYALLTAAFGVIGVGTWPLIADSIGLVYQQLDTDTQDIWEVPPPAVVP